MKDKIKSIVGNGLPYGILFFGLSFLLGYLIHLGFQKSLLMSASIGIFTLLGIGLVHSRFAKPLKVLEDISIQLDASETILLQAPANHLIEDSLVPGKLFLTDQRLIFKVYATGKNSLE